MLSATQAAERLGISRMRMNQLIRSGRIEAERIGNQWAIREEDLETYTPNPPGRPKEK